MNNLTHQTRIAINLIVEDDSGQVAQFLAALTALIELFITVVQWIKPAVVWLSDLIEAITFTVKVFAIGFNALAYGFGVRT